MDTVLLIIIIVVGVLILACLAVTAVIFRMCIMRPKKPADNEKEIPQLRAFRDELAEGRSWFLAQERETLTMESFDGLTLYADYLPCENARGTLILMHGFQSSGLNDFACVFRHFHELGFNLLVPDQRSMNRSEGRYITFGVRERFDCRDWAKLINRKPEVAARPIILDGISMGCTTVLMALGLELPENVAGAIADCGFTTPAAIFKHVLKHGYHLPAFPFIPVSAAATKLIAGFGINECSTLDAVRKTSIPVLFVHGGSDDFVPTYMTVENYEACASEKTLFIADGAGHGMSYLIKREECERLLGEFLDKYAPAV